ncbi:nitrous oxide reductase accessory protein NosL [Natronobacterium gregoryi]|uniref:Lipoprotein n=2 Tax=Natronobacterium gregoryi TaxID=44930 RepID=L0ALH0_NATGS|nr:nitrous oxide reductase accessory protein NosL [Natronobacterium gregoryi]AFZ74299.1 putative lipoprotein involved in nitrous oxide reduction [Natronobacterium gregoryi SP2]ELY63759.1 lipoprotein [Natronobacterium gregoryi SP2]PLK22191.1 hypothetical protein CYV19_00515 [Natronobacterium gregoryi SP2]SFI53240.1 NosL protein [Natronobacterium gregoryi]
MENTPNTTYRRRVLGSIGIGTAVSLTGCLGDGESTERDEDDNSEEVDEQINDGPEQDDGDEETLEQVEFPDGEECGICNMVVGEHPDWNAQLVHDDGHREFFCSAGCMAAYYGAPAEFGGPDAEIDGVWVTDFETGELIDASEASFVRVADPDHVDDIMMRNPTPFADRDDADAFVDEFEEYDEDDIIELSAFDRELAEFYRSGFFEDDENGDGDGHDH